MLAEKAHQFREAVAHRRESIASADRFYRDLMVYQWRLEALDARLAAVTSAADGLRDDEEFSTIAAGHAVESEHSDRRAASLELVLTALRDQRRVALAALEERAAHYAVGVPAATGRLEYVATDEVDRQRCLDNFRNLAQTTYDEMADEAHEILEIAPGDVGLHGLRAALKRRMEFWNGQLEETWAAWQSATERMHRSGEDTLVAWDAVKTTVNAVLLHCQLSEPLVEACDGNTAAMRQQKDLSADVLQAFAMASARCLEVELFERLGLSGLQACMLATDFSSESRLALLTSMLRCLKAADALHRVGEALVQASPSRVASGTPLSLCRAGAWPGSTMETLEPWLVESLVEALCDAAQRGDSCRGSAVLQFSHALGDDDFMNVVRSAPSSITSRRGLAAGQIASVNGFANVARVLESWPCKPAVEKTRPVGKAGEREAVGSSFASAKSAWQFDWLAYWRFKPAYTKWVHKAWLGSLL
jgi:hypothetical protein